VDVEVTAECGGTESERVLIMNIQCVVPAGALMVVNSKGRIVYATNALGVMLGVPVRALMAADLQSILPPPSSQLHSSFLKVWRAMQQGCKAGSACSLAHCPWPRPTAHGQVPTPPPSCCAPPNPCTQNLSAVPPPTSCRAGAVVHLLRANGARVPVTLSMAQHDDGERVQHIVKVTPSSEGERLNQQRLVLSVGESGTVVDLDGSAGRGLFGFAPQVRGLGSAGGALVWGQPGMNGVEGARGSPPAAGGLHGKGHAPVLPLGRCKRRRP
jgi:hypothetical protein